MAHRGSIALDERSVHVRSAESLAEQARVEGEALPRSLAQARTLSLACTRCHLYKHATQTVFGEGPAHARLLVVGEQPSDKEDIEGKPFVGPAGRILDKALSEAGIERDEVFVTNAVKHFKFTQRGKRRIHKKPDKGEIDACRWWLDLELKFVKPKIVVAMGTTALRGVVGKTRTISSLRGRVAELPDGTGLVATVHPSFILRVMQDRARSTHEFGLFVEDLKLAAQAAR